MAGHHATASFANDEAIASFHAALAIAGEGEAAVELQAKLANVLWRTQRRGRAREAFQAALRALPAGDTLRRAHLLIRLGRLEVSDSHYEAAWAAYDAAEELLGGDPAGMDAATVEEWLELMIDGPGRPYSTEYPTAPGPGHAVGGPPGARPGVGGQEARLLLSPGHGAGRAEQVPGGRDRPGQRAPQPGRSFGGRGEGRRLRHVLPGPGPAAARRPGRGPGPPGAVAGHGRTDRRDRPAGLQPARPGHGRAASPRHRGGPGTGPPGPGRGGGHA